MKRLFRLARKKDDIGITCNTRCCRTARKLWGHIGLTFVNELIAENLWRAMGWTSVDE